MAHEARVRRRLAALLFVALAPMIALVPSTANACACGCSVFDVGAGLLPQEDDHGGRIFAEYEFSDQTQNYVGSSKAAAALNSDKEIKTSWYNVGFTYSFNRDWGVMARLPVATDRSLTTDTGGPLGIQTYNSKSIGDVEIMGMYTGFFPDMSTGIMFGVKLPTGSFTAPGIDRDTQVGTGSTDLLLGGYHRGLLAPDNSWQYFSNILLRQPFLYQSAPDPQGFFDGNAGVVQLSSMAPPASSTTTGTMCWASTRSLRWGRSSSRTATTTAVPVPIRLIAVLTA